MPLPDSHSGILSGRSEFLRHTAMAPIDNSSRTDMAGNHILKSAIAFLAFITFLAFLAISRMTELTPGVTAGTTAIANVIPQQPDTVRTDADEQLDDQFREYGSVAGAAYQCTPESGRERLVSDIRRAYSRIGELFGTDRAFYFAVHFGTSVDGPFDKAKCPELIKRLRESVLVHGTVNARPETRREIVTADSLLRERRGHGESLRP
jgi:hypothetical protein